MQTGIQVDQLTARAGSHFIKPASFSYAFNPDSGDFMYRRVFTSTVLCGLMYPLCERDTPSFLVGALIYR